MGWRHRGRNGKVTASLVSWRSGKSIGAVHKPSPTHRATMTTLQDDDAMIPRLIRRRCSFNDDDIPSDSQGRQQAHAARAALAGHLQNVPVRQQGKAQKQAQRYQVWWLLYLSMQRRSSPSLGPRGGWYPHPPHLLTFVRSDRM